MQENQFSKRVAEAQNHPLPPRSARVPIFPAEGSSDAGEATDPLASEGPFLTSSEWPSHSELETALLESDPFPFPTSEGSMLVSADAEDLFSDLEPPMPRDTLPSPPPAADEPLRADVSRRAQRQP